MPPVSTRSRSWLRRLMFERIGWLVLDKGRKAEAS
jgi:hypothetical protein